MNAPPELWYVVETGHFLEDGVIVATGYSGKQPYRNKPEYEHLPGAGPIPRGWYIVHPGFYSQRTGPLALPLQPLGHDAKGRTAFQIHGDDKEHDASTGCIILPRVIREGLNKYCRTFRHGTVRLKVV